MTAIDAGQQVEVTTCQVCGSGEREQLFADPPYRVLRCSGCGLVYVSPRCHGEALAAVYGESYWRSEKPREKGYADYASDERLHLKTFRRRLRLLRRFLPPGRLRVLDVGCAAGYFLRVMRDEGHDVYGVELSAAIARHAVEHLGAARVHVGTLHSAPRDQGAFVPGSFDVVTLWDVVEHVPDPQALLHEVRSMLAPGGVLVLETQNVASRWARLLGRRWQHYKHEEHLYHFDPNTVRRLLEQTRFTVLHNTWTYGGKYVRLSFITERAHRLHPALSFALKPLELFRDGNLYVNFGDEMVVFARPAP
ncbi:MAG: class I SAM-dependent methyltransferase [Planctomycetes bacterium]|nr:class I SAM-dependent methyltransferase [Planctomycetota bacterium]